MSRKPRPVIRPGDGALYGDVAMLGVAGRAVCQVVGKQKALGGARRDDAPAVGDRLHIDGQT